MEQATAAGLTLGVEEEFLLVDELSGHTAPRAAAVLATAILTTAATPEAHPEATRAAATARSALHAELMSSQVEAASPICLTLPDLRVQLRHARRCLVAAARTEAALLISSGTPVLADPAPPPLTGTDRFDQIGRTYAGIAADYQTCGCHVHIGVPDRDTAVAVVNHLAPWLPTLLALSGNSPFHEGRDTGYASWRMVQQARFPGSGLAPWCSSAAEYDEHVTRLVDCGALIDERMTFWLARPSPQWPTVEFRVADAALTVDEAVLQAALARALVRTALAELAVGREAPRVHGQVAAAALWSAARYGLHGPGVDLVAERRLPATLLLGVLLRRISDQLAEVGDLSWVRATLRQLITGGTGAQRQRRAALDSPRAVLAMLARHTAA